MSNHTCLYCGLVFRLTKQLAALREYASFRQASFLMIRCPGCTRMQTAFFPTVEELECAKRCGYPREVVQEPSEQVIAAFTAQFGCRPKLPHKLNQEEERLVKLASAGLVSLEVTERLFLGLEDLDNLRSFRDFEASCPAAGRPHEPAAA